MAWRVDAEPEAARKLLLRHAEVRPDRLHVDPFGDMHAISALVRLTFGIGHRLLKAAPDAVGNLAHGFLRLNVSTSSAGKN
ncbi:MAG: hypothetical protein ACLPID_17520 [Beijerinckiaceae bacterium]